MSHSDQAGPASFRLRQLLLAGMLPAVLAAAAAGQGAGVVYYQVTRDDGTITDLTEPPQTEEGIRLVNRISRFGGEMKGFRVLGNRPHGMSVVHPVRTVNSTLRWNGKAWVGPPPRAARKPPGAAEVMAAEEMRRLELTVESLNHQLNDHEQRMLEAMQRLVEATNEQSKHAARKQLDQARADYRQCQKALSGFEGILTELRLLRGEGVEMPQSGALPDHPAGEVRPMDWPSGQGDPPPAPPIGRATILPYRSHIWRLPGRGGPRRYHVAMAHPEPGRFGAFHYVAYADTDGNGLPDRLIAHSPLAEAVTPGGWTRWSFQTDAEVIFVGSTWPDRLTSVYYGRPDDAPPGGDGLGGDVYVSGVFGGLPCWPSPYGPYLGGLQIWVGEQVPRYTRRTK